MAILRKRGVMWNLLIETETCEPAPRQMHAQFLNQLALAADAIQIANQQNAQQQFRIDRRTTSIAIAVLQSLANEAEVDVLIDQPQQMVLWNLIFQSEVVEQRFRARVLTHHERCPPTMAIHNSMVKLCCYAAPIAMEITSKSSGLHRVFQHPRLKSSIEALLNF